MGIRFRCHHCEHELHVKDFQGGKRGRCPACQGKFRIPLRDAEHSLEPDASGEDERPQPGATTLPSPQRSSVFETDVASKATDRHSTPLPTTTVAVASAPPLAAAVAEQPKALIEAPQATWFVRPPSGGQYGPAPSDAMWQWLQENRISRDSLVWCEGWPEWLLASRVFADFFAANQVDVADVANIPSLAAASEQSPASTPADAPAAANGSGPQPSSQGDRNRATRKLRRKRNYTVLIAILSVVMIVLLIALVVVLNSQRAAA